MVVALLRAGCDRVAAREVADGARWHAAWSESAGESGVAEAVVGGLFEGEARVHVFVVGFGVLAVVPG